MELEISSILEELEGYKANDRRQKNRIVMLEKDLEAVIQSKKTVTAAAGSRTSSRESSRGGGGGSYPSKSLLTAVAARQTTPNKV